MRRIDMLIVGVLAVSAIASAVGVFAYEDIRGVQTFEVTWQTRDVPLAEESVGMGGAAEQTFTFTINATNITSVLVALRIDGGAPRLQDVAGLAEVTPPGREPIATEFTLPTSPTGAGVDVPLEVPLVDVPNATQVDARSREEAIALAFPANATSAAMGEWTLRVQLSATTPGPLAGTYTVSYAAIGRNLDGDATTQLPDVGR